jgi:hypothetical protein
MQAQSRKRDYSVVDEVIQSVRYGERSNSLLKEVEAFERIIRAMGQLLTPEQCIELKAMDTVKRVLHQDNELPDERAFCGSIGGFGTEVLEAWEWLGRSPIG